MTLLDRLWTTSPRSKKSTAALVVGNLWELVGVLVLGWDVFLLVYVYWCENVVVGLFNLPRLVLAGGWQPSVTRVLEKVIAVPFFIVHFGMFTGFQGALLSVMWLWFGLGLRPEKQYGLLELFTITFQQGGWPLWSAILLLAMSHGYSFCVNTVGGREYRNTNLSDQMFAPYLRVAIMMGVVIGGLLVFLLIEAPSVLGVLLVAAKIVFDVRAHLKERATLARAR